MQTPGKLLGADGTIDVVPPTPSVETPPPEHCGRLVGRRRVKIAARRVQALIKLAESNGVRVPMTARRTLHDNSGFERDALEVLAGGTTMGTLRLYFTKWVSFRESRMVPFASFGRQATLDATMKFDELNIAAPSPRIHDGASSPGSSTASPQARRRRKAVKSRQVRFENLHGPVKGRVTSSLPPSFLECAREVKPAPLSAEEVCPELSPLMISEYPLYGLFSDVEPPEWSNLRNMCTGYPVAEPFIRELSSLVDSIDPRARLLERARGAKIDNDSVPAEYFPLLSVVTQLVSFYVTLKNNTNVSFDRFASCFAPGGLIALGPAMLVALAVSSAASYGFHEHEEDVASTGAFVSAAQRACRMALMWGSVAAEHYKTLPKAPLGQSYVLQVHNISAPCLDLVLSYINERPGAIGRSQVSYVLASRSYYISGYPADLAALREHLRSLATAGFKFGVRFVMFPGPVLSPLNKGMARALLRKWRGLGGLAFNADELRLEVLSASTGKQLRESEDLLTELVDCLTLETHSVMHQETCVPFKAGVVSFEVTNNPSQLSGHNLVTSQLTLQTPYLRCVSQPYSFTHIRPSLDDLQPRNNTPQGRKSMLIKGAVVNEILASQGSEERIELLTSWLELGYLERSNEEPHSPAGLHGFRAFKSPCGSALSSPVHTPIGASIGADLRSELAEDLDRIAHSSNLYNVERIEALGPLLTQPTRAGREFINLLQKVTGYKFAASTLHRCPNVISLIEFWDMMDVTKRTLRNSPPQTPLQVSQVAFPDARKRGSSPVASESSRASRGYVVLDGRTGSRAKHCSTASSVGARIRPADTPKSDRSVANSIRSPPDSPVMAERRRFVRDRMRHFYGGVGSGTSV
eukprot:TRINITY_DN6233_c0_g1_i1.p1 TRINITY_DN6233_c0_g1~~TRINITY_DN6233_c0_g1_i1.p1  ORF type:complete len:884 (+),score=178.20 TRINITY_DN6233_c0_g1_i1:57-2654(+)